MINLHAIPQSNPRLEAAKAWLTKFHVSKVIGNTVYGLSTSGKEYPIVEWSYDSWDIVMREYFNRFKR